MMIESVCARSRWPLLWLSLVLLGAGACCGRNSSETKPDDPTAKEASAQTATAPGKEAVKPAVRKVETKPEEVLAIIAGAQAKLVGEWNETESYTVAHTKGPAPLVGMKRERILAALGEPDKVHEDGRHMWVIGKVPERSRNPPPKLIFTFDAEGKVATVSSRLGR